MFSHILAPLDGSVLAECVLPHVVALARPLGARVTLLRAVEPPVPSRGHIVDTLDWSLAQAEAQAYLDGWCSRLTAVNVQARSLLLVGRAADQIIHAALTEGASLLVMSSHGSSGLTGWNISSTVQKVLLGATLSTMIVRAHQPPRPELTGVVYQRLLVPLDASQRADFALAAAMTLARAHGAELVLAHVVSRPELVERVPPPAEDVALVDRLVERNRGEATRHLEQIQDRMVGEGIRARFHLVVGDHTSAALHQLIAEENADLVIVCAHGNSGDVPWPLGIGVLNLVTYGTTPLLIVQDVAPGKVETAHISAPAETRRPMPHGDFPI